MVITTSWGGDSDPKAIAIARSNAEKAGVEDLVRFEVADATAFSRSSDHGQLVTNPPYGERLLEQEEAGRLYRAFGQAAAALPEKWRVQYPAPPIRSLRHATAAWRPKSVGSYNGMIKCDLFMYYR